VRWLLDHGAEIDARDANFDGTPLGYATVGNGEHAGAVATLSPPSVSCSTPEPPEQARRSASPSP
jgi:hypothetical protein